MTEGPHFKKLLDYMSFDPLEPSAPFVSQEGPLNPFALLKGDVGTGKLKEAKALLGPPGAGKSKALEAFIEKVNGKAPLLSAQLAKSAAGLTSNPASTNVPAPPSMQSAALTLTETRDHWQSVGVDPAELAVSSQSLIAGQPTPEEVKRLAVALSGPSGAPTARHVYAALVAAVGATVARRLADRSQLRERWSTLFDVIQKGGHFIKTSPEQAEALAKDLTSAAAAELRDRLADASGFSADTFSAVVNTALEAGLSRSAVGLVVRESHGKLSLEARHAADALLRLLYVSSELRGIFKMAGSATQLRDISVKALLDDEALALDAFQVFIEANDRALKLIADMAQFAAEALQEGRDFSACSRGASLRELAQGLRAEVSRMLDWAASTCNVRFVEASRMRGDSVLGQLELCAQSLEQVFSMGYHDLGGLDFQRDLASGLVPEHVAQPYTAFLAICSKSKAEVTVDTIETVEELIRVLHREVAHGYGEHIKKLTRLGLALKKTHAIDVKHGNHHARLALTYVGNHTPETLGATPLGAVHDALRAYYDLAGNQRLAVSSGVLTDKNLAFDVQLGAHQGRLSITYDPTHNDYFVEWGLQEPSADTRRVQFCRDYFGLAGFAQTVDGMKHTVRRKVSRDDIHRTVWLMMFSLENMKNVDISQPVLSPKALMGLFDVWYAGRSPAAVDKASLSAHAAEILRRNQAWGDLERAVLATMLADPFVFRAGELRSSAGGKQEATVPMGYVGSEQPAARRPIAKRVVSAFSIFLATHAEALLGATPSKKRALEALDAMRTVYFNAVQPLIMDEIKALGVVPTPVDSKEFASDLKQFIVGVDLGAEDLARALMRWGGADANGPIFQETRSV